MTHPADTSPAADDSPGAGERAETGRRMRALAAELTAAGLDTHLHDTHGVLDIRATAHPTGSKPVEIIYDEDGYTQVSYWSEPAVAPAQVTAVISRVLAVITGPL
jgi:hypothetical protein